MIPLRSDRVIERRFTGPSRPPTPGKDSMRHSRIRCAAIIPMLAFGCHRAVTVDHPVAVRSTEWSEGAFHGRRFETEHFVIYSTVRDEPFESTLPLFIEASFNECHAIMPVQITNKNKLTTYVFGRRSEWQRFIHMRYPERAEVYSRIRSGGFTEGTVSASFYSTRSGTLATIAHETWHQFVAANLPGPIPAWLNEGIACRLESVQARGDKFVFTPDHHSLRINSLREAVQLNRLIPLERLIETDAGEVIGQSHEAAQTYYAQVWVLVNFLESGENGRYRQGFRRLLSDVADGTYRLREGASRITGSVDGAGLESAVLESYFGTTPEALSESYYNALIRVSGLR